MTTLRLLRFAILVVVPILPPIHVEAVAGSWEALALPIVTSYRTYFSDLGLRTKKLKNCQRLSRPCPSLTKTPPPPNQSPSPRSGACGRTDATCAVAVSWGGGGRRTFRTVSSAGGCRNLGPCWYTFRCPLRNCNALWPLVLLDRAHLMLPSLQRTSVWRNQ